MKLLKITVVGLFITGLLTLGGCGKNEAVTKTEEWADATCKCKDMKCAEEASKAFKDWATKNADAKGTEADMKKIETATKKATECLTKLATAGISDAMKKAGAAGAGDKAGGEGTK